MFKMLKKIVAMTIFIIFIKAAPFDQNNHPFPWWTMLRPIRLYHRRKPCRTDLVICCHPVWQTGKVFSSVLLSDSRCSSQSAIGAWVQEKKKGKMGETPKLIIFINCFNSFLSSSSFLPTPSPPCGWHSEAGQPLGKSATSAGRWWRGPQWPAKGCVALAKDILEWNSKQKLNQRDPGGNQETWEPKQYMLGKKNDLVGSQLGWDKVLLPIYASVYSFILQILWSAN